MSIVHRRGYGLESHWAQTHDGYLLGLFRITPRPHRGDGMPLEQRPPVLLQHALLDSSFAWVSNYEARQSLAMLLSDQGYDVWLGNNRGNVYSRNHTSLDPDRDSAFWDFTYADMGMYDLPAEIRYVLEYRLGGPAVAGNVSAPRLELPRRCIGYIGHSEGTMQAFAGFTMPHNREEADAVALFVALAPVAFLSHMTSPIIKGLAGSHADDFAKWVGIRELLPGTSLNGLSPEACRQMPEMCAGVLDLVTGESDELNMTRLQVQLARTPAGTSIKNLAHFLQGIRAGHFRQYDYGSHAENLRRYGSIHPPHFELHRLRVPTALFSGSNDALASPADVRRLERQLRPTGAIVEWREIDNFAHLDFTWSTRAADVVYKPLCRLLQTRHLPLAGPGPAPRSGVAWLRV